MEIYERVRELRKKYLKMSMEAFGDRLGVSRDTINNIELNRLARLEQKTSLFKLMCSEFNVNEEWLFKGIEPVFVQTPTSVMEDLRQEFNLDDFAFNLVYEYLKLDESERKMIRDFLYRVVNQKEGSDLISEAPGSPEELERSFPPVGAPDDESKIS